jgi:hypothetical protein
LRPIPGCAIRSYEFAPISKVGSRSIVGRGSLVVALAGSRGIRSTQEPRHTGGCDGALRVVRFMIMRESRIGIRRLSI